jgi:putative CocE/NonD family hydrolase
VDQTPILGRRDVLEFTSTSLESALEVTGPVRAVLFVSSTAPDTDWVVKLCDVHPDGRTLNVCDGILRMSSQVDATATSPGQIGSPRRCEIDLWSTSHVFLAGHRIRLLVTSSDFPRYDVNPNTGDLGVHAQAFAIAHQRVFCDSSRPSHVLLPIVDL